MAYRCLLGYVSLFLMASHRKELSGCGARQTDSDFLAHSACAGCPLSALLNESPLPLFGSTMASEVHAAAGLSLCLLAGYLKGSRMIVALVHTRGWGQSPHHSYYSVWGVRPTWLLMGNLNDGYWNSQWWGSVQTISTGLLPVRSCWRKPTEVWFWLIKPDSKMAPSESLSPSGELSLLHSPPPSAVFCVCHHNHHDHVSLLVPTVPLTQWSGSR